MNNQSQIQIVKSSSCLENGIILYRITNSSGAYVELLNYGATIASIVVPNRHNKLENIVLSYNDITLYLIDKFYLGATIGRFANRISGSKFKLGENTFNLDQNDGVNSNHGGFNGLNSKLFASEIQKDKLVFSTMSENGEGGFPGDVKVSVVYSFSDNNILRIEFISQSNEDTPINFTNHAYFNLSGKRGVALDHLLQINSSGYLEMDHFFLPTGKILNVDESAFDFRKYRQIKTATIDKKDNLEGYNTFFVKSQDIAKASLRSESSGRQLDVRSSMSGIQLYTGDFLNDKFLPFQGVCLEAQYYPDGINKKHFDVCILKAGEVKMDWIEYAFSVYD